MGVAFRWSVDLVPCFQLTKIASSLHAGQDLYRLVGEKVYVRGKISGLKTYQQKAPLIMEVIEIATR